MIEPDRSTADLNKPTCPLRQTEVSSSLGCKHSPLDTSAGHLPTFPLTPPLRSPPKTLAIQSLLDCKRRLLCSARQNRQVPLGFSNTPAWPVEFTPLLFLLPGAETGGREARVGALLRPRKQWAVAACPEPTPGSQEPPASHPAFPPSPSTPSRPPVRTILPDPSLCIHHGPLTHPLSQDSGPADALLAPEKVDLPSPFPFPSSLFSICEPVTKGTPCPLTGGTPPSSVQGSVAQLREPTDSGRRETSWGPVS